MSLILSNHDLLARLVSFDTVSSHSNLPIVEFICDYLDGRGLTIQRLPNSDGDKANLLVHLGPECDSISGLLLCGHVDVVPADEPEWESDPFHLTQRGDALYGRGACDMKCSVALAVNTLARVAPDTLTAPLVLLLTYDEELGTLGAQHFAAAWPPDQPLPRSVLIGEPTSLRAVRMHKGHMSISVTFLGRGAHSGCPHLGCNALEPAGPFISGLIDIRRRLERTTFDHVEFFPDAPFPILNAARIRGGHAVNIVPEKCTVDIGLRLLPGMESGPIVAELRSLAESVAGETTVEVKVNNESPPLLLPEDSTIHRALCELLSQNESHGVPYASDGGPLQHGLDLECALFGPGSIDVAHRPNEFVPIDEFHHADEIYHALVKRFCLNDDPHD